MAGKQLILVVIIVVISALSLIESRPNSEGDGPTSIQDFSEVPFGKIKGRLKRMLLEPGMKRTPGLTPYISIGALSNMHQFFHQLKNNFISLDQISDDEARSILRLYRPLGECDNRHKQPKSTKMRMPTHSYSFTVREDGFCLLRVNLKLKTGPRGNSETDR